MRPQPGTAGAPSHRELSDRLGRFQLALQEAGIDLALLRQNADLYYLTGTVQDGHLVVPARGEPVFWVWRSWTRAVEECSHLEVEPINKMSDLEEAMARRGLTKEKVARKIGLELDVLPAAHYLRYSQRLWPAARVADVTPVLRHLRAVKSPWEISCIEEACRMARKALDAVPSLLRPGITELELAAGVESILRVQGHPGILRMRGWNQEMAMGQVVAGRSGCKPSWTLTPVGGTGPGPAFGMGAGFSEIEAGMPVSVDIGGWSQGYCCDQTRLFYLRKLPAAVQEAADFTVQLLTEIEAMVAPGLEAGALFEYAMERARQEGFHEGFMGVGTDKVRFIGHGLGLELDEYPFLSQGNPMSLVPGMVFACEPKVVTEYGVAGVEDTFVVTDDGCRRLTLGPMEPTAVKA